MRARFAILRSIIIYFFVEKNVTLESEYRKWQKPICKPEGKE